MVVHLNQTYRMGISRCSDDAYPSTPTAAVTTLTLSAGCKPLFGGLLSDHTAPSTAQPVAPTTMARRAAGRHPCDGAAALMWRHMDTPRNLLILDVEDVVVRPFRSVRPFPLRPIPT